VSKFRISAHQLRIETGHYERKKNQAGKISILEREERVCLYGNLSNVEDESHFLLECPLYNHKRSTFFNEIGSICEFFLSLNNHDKFYWVLDNVVTFRQRLEHIYLVIILYYDLVRHRRYI
jgi:hypothetical protein